jgi:hypothetical protein
MKIAEGVLALVYAFPVWYFLVRPRWPWDWKGTRKDITLRTRRHDWDDDD